MSYHERDATMERYRMQGGRNPYDGGGVNLNPRPIGRNAPVRTFGRTKPRKAPELVGRRNRRAIGETDQPAGDRRADMMFGYY